MTTKLKGLVLGHKRQHITVCLFVYVLGLRHTLNDDNKEGVQEEYLELKIGVELEIYQSRTQKNHHITR